MKASTQKALALAACMMGALLSLACLDRNKPAPDQDSEPADTTLAPVKMPELDVREGPRAVFSRPLQRLVVEFRVHLISGPSGTFGDGSPLWAIASGVLPDAATMPRIFSNGFRAAVGRESDRAALMEYLDGVEGLKMRMDQAMPNVDRPVTIELGPCRPWESVFYYDLRGELHGLDLVEASARLILRFEMRSINLKEVWIDVTPELEEPPGPMRWVRDADGELIERPELRRHTLSDLRIAAQIPEGGFLVLGASPIVVETPVIGRSFFLEEGGDEAGGTAGPRERIYVISPIVRFLETDVSAAPGS